MKGMMRIIEIVLPVRNLEYFLADKLDSTSLIHKILSTTPDYALIPPRLPLTIRPSGVTNDPSDREFAPKRRSVEEVLLLAQA
jgi:hypothetical protein